LKLEKRKGEKRERRKKKGRRKEKFIERSFAREKIF